MNSIFIQKVFKRVRTIIRYYIFKILAIVNRDLFLAKIIHLRTKPANVKNTEIFEINIANDELEMVSVEPLFYSQNTIANYKYTLDFKFSEKSPTGYWEIQNALYHPSFHCLYTNSGERINFSCYSTKLLCMPSFLEIPARVKFIEDEFVYIGDFMAEKHYGHFLLEGTSVLFYITIVR